MALGEQVRNFKKEGNRMVRYILNKADSIGTAKNRKGEFFLFYTILFASAAIFIFSWYYLAGRTLVWQNDGWSQHYKALVYYAKYMRSIIKGVLFEHRLVIPSWDFNIGEGSDIISALHYYVIGDPFAVFSVFVPTKYMYLYYGGMIILRLYLAGAAFSLLCFQTGQKSRFAVMAGALTYVFCYWAILNAGRHPYFLNPMVYLPLMILGIEKILRKERPYIYIMSVCIAAVSNFYFFYMLVLVTVLYVSVRLVSSYRRDIKAGFGAFARIAGASVLGVCMGAVLFLPVCYIFLSDARMSVGNAVHLFYPLSYYSKLPGIFVAGMDSYWMCMGYTAPVLLAVFLLFYRRKEHSLLKVLFLIGGVIMLFPFFGHILNGFSYVSNRWCWAFALLSAYILTVMWPFFMELGAKEGQVLLLCTAGYFGLCLLLEYSRNIKVFAALAMALFFLFLIFPAYKNERGGVNGKRKQQFALLLVFLCVLNAGFWKYSSGGDNYAAEGVEAVRVRQELMKNETAAIKKIANEEGVDSFYRYSGRSLAGNANILAGLSSTQYYWSLSNPYVSQFREEMEMTGPHVHSYQGYDDRAALLALAAVRYYAVPGGNTSDVPYGFTLLGTIDVKESIVREKLELLKKELGTEELTAEQRQAVQNAAQSKYSVYRNDYALPLAYAYDSRIEEKAWESLDAVEKQEAVLQGIYLEGYNGDLKETMLQLDSREIEYTLSCNGSNITQQGDSFVVTKENASVTLEWEGMPGCETYFSLEGISYQGVPEYELYFGEEAVDPLNLYNRTNWDMLSFKDREAKTKSRLFWVQPSEIKFTLKTSSGVSKSFTYCTEECNFYGGLHDFTVHFGYGEEAVTYLTMTFPVIGVYSFSAMKVYCGPMENYGQRVQALGKDTLQDMYIGTDTVSGKISLTEEKALCFAIPYSAGWKAYVDGEETELYRANRMYMAIDLPAGEHEVSLRYRTPVLGVGVFVSAAAFAVFIGYIVYRERGRRQYLS